MKITKYFLSLAAAAGMIAGCQKQEMVQIAAPEDVVAPVLGKVAEITITKDNLNTESVTFKWAAADFGAATQVNYAIEIAAVGSDEKAVLTSGINSIDPEVKSTVPYKDLNTFLINNLNLEPEVKVNLDFYVSAKVGEYEKIYSEAVKVAVTPLDVILPEVDMYGHINVIGKYCDWNFSKTQYLFNYDKKIYSGVVDFYGLASQGWKLAVPTADGEWDNAANWGLDGSAAAPEAEASPITLICDGGSADMKLYSKRFYNLEFDRESLTLKVKHSFNKLCVIGAYNGWDAATEKEMKYNPTYVRFFVDVEAATDGGLLCRADGDWTLKFGIENKEEDIAAGLAVKEGGQDMGLKAGNYRIYLDLNKGTVVADAKMYGQPEPGYVEPVLPDPGETTEVSWYLIGGFNGWKESDENYKMTKGDEYYEFKNLVLESESALQFNVGSWSDKRSGTFAKDAAIDAAAGSDMTVPAGTYDVYMNLALDKIYFMTPGKTPADAGEAEVTYIDASNIIVGFVGDEYGWGDPAEQYRATFVSKELTDAATYSGTYVYKKEGLVITNGKGLKVRINGEWIGVGNATIEGLTYTGTDNIVAGEGGTFNAQITFTWNGLKPSETKIVFSR